jgi:hypothetical protein
MFFKQAEYVGMPYPVTQQYELNIKSESTVDELGTEYSDVR